MIAVRTSQRGVALIVALLVVALATILIAALLSRGELGAARLRNVSREAQADAYAKGLEAFAADVLSKDDAQTDFADDPWAIPLPPTPVPGGEITATMTDLDGRFNLNNLVPTIVVGSATQDNPNLEAWRATFERLLNALKLDPNLEKNVENWMSLDASGADAWYAQQAVPYRSAKRTFAHVSELRLVQGFDGDTYARILPYVSALPIGTTINVNTAAVPVLETLNDTVTEESATALWQQGHAHFTQWSTPNGATSNSGSSNQQATQSLPQAKYRNCFGFTSSYFSARGDVALDGLHFTFYSLIERRAVAGAGVRVLLRNRGGE